MCIALIESSVGVLLHCLEMVDGDSAVTEGFLAWEVNDGVKCASFLRRIYEEVSLYLFCEQTNFVREIYWAADISLYVF